uniref:Uncharacterized protein n=1 Tax=Arundo donax TaxID=35708 RepID=A0A0A9AC46_ARUDO
MTGGPALSVRGREGGVQEGAFGLGRQQGGEGAAGWRLSWASA